MIVTIELSDSEVKAVARTWSGLESDGPAPLMSIKAKLHHAMTTELANQRALQFAPPLATEGREADPTVRPA